MEVSPKTFGLSKSILPIEIPFGLSKTCGSSNFFVLCSEFLKSILSFEMTNQTYIYIYINIVDLRRDVTERNKKNRVIKP